MSFANLQIQPPNENVSLSLMACGFRPLLGSNSPFFEGSDSAIQNGKHIKLEEETRGVLSDTFTLGEKVITECVDELIGKLTFIFIFYLHIIPSYVFYINYYIRNIVCPRKLFTNTKSSAATEPMPSTIVDPSTPIVTLKKKIFFRNRTCVPVGWPFGHYQARTSHIYTKRACRTPDDVEKVG